MGLRTPEEYVESLRRQSPEVYARGETVYERRRPPAVRVDHGLLGLVGVPRGVGSGDARHDGHVARPERRGVPRLLAHGDQPGGPAAEPARRPDAVGALAPVGLCLASAATSCRRC